MKHLSNQLQITPKTEKKNSKIFKSLLKYLLLVSICLTAIGCKKRAPIDSARHLNISFRSEVRSLDPRFGIDYPSVYAIKMLFDGLMRIGLDGKVIPAIAESYEVSPDRKTYTFHLRNAFWSNGDQITAYDFEYSWKSVVDPKTKTVGGHNFYPIKNVQKIVTGSLPIDTMGIKALNANTLVVELEHPTPYFLEVVSTVSYLPINKRVDEQQPNWANTEGSSFVCNGPFVLVKNQLDHEILVEKNPTYWSADEVKLPGINIAIVKDPMTHLQLFEKGELDWAGKPTSRMPLEAIEDLKKRGKVTFAPFLGLYWLFVNTQTVPFNNKKMRLAFAYAINRKLITDHVLYEEEVPAMGLLPYTLSLQKEPYFADNQSESARALFDEALVEMGLTREELPEISFDIANEPIVMKVAQALQVQWNQALGIQVKIEHQEWRSHFSKLQNGDYQIGGMGWYSWLRDPIYILQTFRYRADGINMSRWEDPRYQAFIDASEMELDPKKRLDNFHQAEALLMDEMPVIPLYFSTISYMKDDKLKDVYISELNEVDYRWAYFSNE